VSNFTFSGIPPIHLLFGELWPIFFVDRRKGYFEYISLNLLKMAIEDELQKVKKQSIIAVHLYGTATR